MTSKITNFQLGNKQQHEQFIMKQYSCLEINKHQFFFIFFFFFFFLLTSETPDELFTAAFLKLSITWFSEIVK